MNARTTLTTVGAITLLLVVIGVVSMLFMQPAIPNTGSESASTTLDIAAQSADSGSVGDDNGMDTAPTSSGDSLIMPAGDDHSE